MKDFEDPSVPVVEYSPDTLEKLRNAYEVLMAAQEEMVAEQNAAIDRIANEHAEHIARCAAIYHTLRAEAYAMGFSLEQVSRQLGEGDLI